MKQKKIKRLYIFGDNSYIEPKDWQKHIRSEIHKIRKVYSESTKKDNRVINELLDFTPALEKRRTTALINSLKKMDESHARYADGWISINLLCASYSSLEMNGHILKAASIWILDRLTEYNVEWSKIFPLLPTDEELLNDLFPTDIWDCCYEEKLIASVEYILTYRNQDVAPLESNGDDGYRLFTSELAAEGKEHVDVLSRRNFEALLALLPQSVKDDAVKHFENCFQAWADRFFRGIAYLHEKSVEKMDALNKMHREMKEIQDKLEKKSNQYTSKQRRMKKAMHKPASRPSVNVLLSNSAQSDNIIAMPTGDFSKNSMSLLASDTLTDSIAEIEKLNDRLEVLDKMRDKADEDFRDSIHKRSSFLSTLSQNGYLHEDIAEEYFPSEIREVILKPLPFTDPYELCFALLYLIETGSDIPWIYGACIDMMTEVVDSLPWGVTYYDEFDDPYWDGVPPVSDNKPDFPDWYKREYSWKGNNEYDVRNLAQIVYEATGCLMPRNLHRYDVELGKLGNYGIKQNKAMSVLYCMLTLSNSRHQKSANNLDPDYMKQMLAKSDESDLNLEEQMSPPANWAEQKAEFEKQIQQLRTSLHDAEKRAAEALKQIERQKESAEAEQRELADLREIIFNKNEFENLDNVTDESVDESRYPYFVEKSTVVFGGHETWVKSLKPLFKGNIKFIAKEMKIDVSHIRHADVIWVQTNAISHASFYSIANAARKLRIGIRYFTNASSKKCAEQIVENDKKINRQ